MNSNFCILPFTHLSTRVDGNVAPCCRSLDTVGSIKQNTIQEIWNNEKMQALRTAFIHNDKPVGCVACWKLEEQGSISMRQSMLDVRKHMMPESIQPVMPFDIPVLELKLSNLCNFRCRTCKPDLSTTWLKDWDAVKDEYDAIGMKYNTGRQQNYEDSFLEDIERLGPSFEIIEFAGGEPLMDPMHYRVLEALQPFAHNIQVKYSTNLSKLTYGRYNALQAWKNFKSIDLSVSVDGYPDLNHYIRTESDNTILEENIKIIRKELGDKVTGRAALCYNAWNVMGLPESYDYFTNVLDMPVHGNIAWAPNFISPQVLPLELKKQATEKYKKYLETVPTMKTEENYKKRIKRFINMNMNYLNAEDHSKHFERFISFSKKLDVTRDTDLVTVIPEFADYV